METKEKPRLWVILFWLGLWQCGSVLVGHTILLPSPAQTMVKLWTLLGQELFWLSIATSLARISLGFFTAFLLAVLLGVLARRYLWLRDLITPMILVAKSVPVASFTILILIWLSASHLSVVISFFMVLPILYTNVVTALAELDQELEEMTQVFQFLPYTRLRYVILPQVVPYLRSGSLVALGLSFKAGIAAELIGLPQNSIGEQLYFSKLYLDTPNLFAWTLTIILLSFCYERVFLLLFSWICGRLEHIPEKTRLSMEEPQNFHSKHSEILVEGLGKSYGAQVVFQDFSCTIAPDSRTCMLGRSGSGKTTLLRMFMGLESPEQGQITGLEGLRSSVVFQEDRLCQQLSVTANLRLPHLHKNTGLTKEMLEEGLRAMGLEGQGDKLACDLSGGMARRVAILRALLLPCDLLLLDEPFSGLDEATKEKTIAFVRNKTQGKTVLWITHNEGELAQLPSEKILEITLDRLE